MDVIHELIHLTSLAQIGRNDLAKRVAQKLVEKWNYVINQIANLDNDGLIPEHKAKNAAVRIMYYIAKGGNVGLEELKNVNPRNTHILQASPKLMNRVTRMIAAKTRKNQEITVGDLNQFSGIRNQLLVVGA